MSTSTQKSIALFGIAAILATGTAATIASHAPTATTTNTASARVTSSKMLNVTKAHIGAKKINGYKVQGMSMRNVSLLFTKAGGTLGAVGFSASSAAASIKVSSLGLMKPLPRGTVPAAGSLIWWGHDKNLGPAGHVAVYVGGGNVVNNYGGNKLVKTKLKNMPAPTGWSTPAALAR